MMKHKSSHRAVPVLFTILMMVLLVSSCNLPQPGSEIELPEPPQEMPAPEEEVVVDTLIEPLVIPDYSKYAAITDEEYYQNQYLGQIFLIKEWQTTAPQINTLSVYGRISFTVHPNQSLAALDFSDPNQPVILTGFGRGWGKVVTRGEGHGAVSGNSADITMVCTGEVRAEFKMVGGLYPAPTCTLDVDIITTYFPEESIVKCVYNNSLEILLPMETYLDMFTDVKLPIAFSIPNDYVTRFAEAKNNVKYDLSYYLYNFWGSPPSEAELELLFGDQPYKFYQTGCESIHLEFDTGYLPADSEMLEMAPSVWEMMLTPESMRQE